MTITMLRHNKVDLALHILRDGTGTPLLVLHGLGEASPTAVPHWAQQWGGPVAALDFMGTGNRPFPLAAATPPRSSWPTPTSP